MNLATLQQSFHSGIFPSWSTLLQPTWTSQMAYSAVGNIYHHKNISSMRRSSKWNACVCHYGVVYKWNAWVGECIILQIHTLCARRDGFSLLLSSCVLSNSLLSSLKSSVSLRLCYSVKVLPRLVGVRPRVSVSAVVVTLGSSLVHRVIPNRIHPGPLSKEKWRN